MTLVHNPRAGGTARNDAPRLVELLRAAGHEVRYQSSREESWDDALAAPADVIAVAGGDGIIARVAKRMLDSDVPVAPLPVGTANNIARTLGLCDRPLEELVQGWRDGRIVSLEVGFAHGPWGSRRFVEGVGAGLFAQSIEKARASALESMPHADAKVTYMLQLLKETVAHCAPVAVRAELDGVDVSGDYLLFEALTIPYVGPNLFIAPDSRVGDGCFELVLAGEAERERLGRYLAHWQDGKARLPVLPSRRGRRLRIEWSGFTLHIDDKSLPKRRAPAQSGRVEVGLEGKGARFLAPSAKNSG